MHKYSKKLYNVPFYPNGTAWNGFPACLYSLSSETLLEGLRQGACLRCLDKAGGRFHFTQFGHKLFFIFFLSK